MKIFLKLEKKPKILAEVILALFDCYCFNHLKGVETYFDEKCLEIQCKAGKYRSFDDIYIIAKTYFPEVTEKDVIHELLIRNFKTSGVNLNPWFTFCGSIHMPTLIYYHDLNSGDSTFIDNPPSNISKYTWKSVLELVGITNLKELKEYITNNKIKETEKQIE
jgi:hypothetical protein